MWNKTSRAESPASTVYQTVISGFWFAYCAAISVFPNPLGATSKNAWGAGLSSFASISALTMK